MQNDAAASVVLGAAADVEEGNQNDNNGALPVATSATAATRNVSSRRQRYLVVAKVYSICVSMASLLSLAFRLLGGEAADGACDKSIKSQECIV